MISSGGFWWGSSDPFEAVARYNGDKAKAAWQADQVKHSRSSGLVSPDEKKARRAKDKRARQARKAHRSKP